MHLVRFFTWFRGERLSGPPGWSRPPGAAERSCKNRFTQVIAASTSRNHTKRARNKHNRDLSIGQCVGKVSRPLFLCGTNRPTSRAPQCVANGTHLIGSPRNIGAPPARDSPPDGQPRPDPGDQAGWPVGENRQASSQVRWGKTMAGVARECFRIVSRKGRRRIRRISTILTTF